MAKIPANQVEDDKLLVARVEAEPWISRYVILKEGRVEYVNWAEIHRAFIFGYRQIENISYFDMCEYLRVKERLTEPRKGSFFLNVGGEEVDLRGNCGRKLHFQALNDARAYAEARFGVSSDLSSLDVTINQRVEDLELEDS